MGSHGPLSTPPNLSTATHPGAKVDLEDGTVAPSTEQVVLGQVHSHGHDAHVKQHGEQELARRDLPQLGVQVGQVLWLLCSPGNRGTGGGETQPSLGQTWPPAPTTPPRTCGSHCRPRPPLAKPQEPGSRQAQTAKWEFPSRHRPGLSTLWPSLRREASGD